MCRGDVLTRPPPGTHRGGHRTRAGRPAGDVPARVTEDALRRPRGTCRNSGWGVVKQFAGAAGGDLPGRWRGTWRRLLGACQGGRGDLPGRSGRARGGTSPPARPPAPRLRRGRTPSSGAGLGPRRLGTVALARRWGTVALGPGRRDRGAGIAAQASGAGVGRRRRAPPNAGRARSILARPRGDCRGGPRGRKAPEGRGFPVVQSGRSAARTRVPGAGGIMGAPAKHCA